MIVYTETDPTTEVMARHFFEHIKAAIAQDATYPTAECKPAYRIGKNVALERVRVWETTDSWAEYWE